MMKGQFLFQWRIQAGAQQARTPSKFWSTMFFVGFLKFYIRTLPNKGK